MSDLEGYIILTEDQYRENVNNAIIEATEPAIQAAVKEERQKFNEITMDLQADIQNLQDKNTVYVGALWGLGITATISLAGIITMLIVR